MNTWWIEHGHRDKEVQARVMTAYLCFIKFLCILCGSKKEPSAHLLPFIMIKICLKYSSAKYILDGGAFFPRCMTNDRNLKWRIALLK